MTAIPAQPLATDQKPRVPRVLVALVTDPFVATLRALARLA